eukprot:87467-Pelagomonas_calceolata.AAC.1
MGIWRVFNLGRSGSPLPVLHRIICTARAKSQNTRGVEKCKAQGGELTRGGFLRLPVWVHHSGQLLRACVT